MELKNIKITKISLYHKDKNFKKPIHMYIYEPMMKKQKKNIKFPQLQCVKIDINVLKYKMLLCSNTVAYTDI